MPITIRDIAKEAGVSAAAVSMAFSGSPRVSDKRRKQIVRIGQRLGYTPNRMARALKGGRTQTLGVLVNDLTNPFYALIVRAVQNAADKHGYEILVTDSQFQARRETVEIQRLIQAHVDGVLACFGRSAQESSGLLARHDIPHLALDTAPKDYDGPYVLLSASARLSVEHLLDIGCRRIAMFTGSQDTRWFSAFEALEEEFTQTLRAHGQPCGDDSIAPAGLDFDTGRRAMARLLDQHPDVDGLFCANSLCAIGAMEVAADRGRRIGEDLAVVGIDDLDICALRSISLTAIRQPYPQMATIATNLLIASIEDDEALDTRMCMQPELVVRASTKRSR